MAKGLRFIATALVLGLATGTAAAQSTRLVSVDSNGLPSNSLTDGVSISADGRWVVFTSYATNLVAGDTNGYTDVFVHEIRTGATTRVSVDSSGAQANHYSRDAAISGDGRYVAFQSAASNLVAGDTNGFNDVFVHDRATGATTLVSVSTSGVQGDGPSGRAAISPDGRFVGFASEATNLVPGDTNGETDVFVRDLASGVTTRVNVDSLGGQSPAHTHVADGPSIAGDGRSVAFSTNAGLVPEDTLSAMDGYVHDLQSGQTARVSVSSSGAEAVGDCTGAKISADGRFVTFSTYASNLVPGDTNGAPDVFVHDRAAGLTTRVSVDSSGAQVRGGLGLGSTLAISADGRFVAFASWSDSLVAGDTNGYTDVFLHDSLSGETTRVDVSSSGAQVNDMTWGASVSADGRRVAFWSFASNLVPDDGIDGCEAFVHDRGAGSALVSYCSGDGSAGACPCGNTGSAGRGCDNSPGTGGALLVGAGAASLSSDSLVLTASGETDHALSIFLQGTESQSAVAFGDGLRCAGGTLTRLYTSSASGGGVSAPGAGPSITSRSAALGDPIPMGHSRFYQVHYRDADSAFCSAPAGSTFNATNALAVAWGS